MGKACTRGLSAREDSARDSGHREETDRIARIVVALHPEDGRRDRVQVGRAGRGEWRRSASADRREGNLERGAGIDAATPMAGIEAPGCRGSEPWGLVVVHDHAMIVVIVIGPTGIVMAMVMVAVVVMMGTVVMVMAVATHARGDARACVGKEGERAHAGRHQATVRRSIGWNTAAARPSLDRSRDRHHEGGRIHRDAVIARVPRPLPWSSIVVGNWAVSIAVRPRRWRSTIARPIASPTFM